MKNKIKNEVRQNETDSKNQGSSIHLSGNSFI